jgi:nucleoside-diphosphate-sugar epimerase
LRNFLFIDDLVRLYEKTINHQRAIAQTFVTGPANAISIDDLVKLCAKVLGWRGVVNWGTQPHRPGEIYYLNSNPAKAKKLLGWEPEWDLEDGIHETATRIMNSRVKAAAE